jgi:heme exporter protein C
MNPKEGEATMAVRSSSGLRWVWFAAAALAVTATVQLYALSISPPDQGMGHLQKIMYVHVPTAWSAFLAFGTVFVCSALYLFTKREKYDMLAVSAAEVGVILTAVTLVLGSIWAKPTWGVWWTWDPRLTTTAILLVIYGGYLALRSFVEEDERRARWSAAVGILAFINVPIVYMSVRWWRTIHQVQSSPSTVDSSYILGLRLNALAVLAVMICFIVLRYRAGMLERAAEARLEEAALVKGEVSV